MFCCIGILSSMIDLLIMQTHSHNFSTLIKIGGVYRIYLRVLVSVTFLFHSCEDKIAFLQDFSFYWSCKKTK